MREEERNKENLELKTSKLPHASKEENVVSTQKIVNRTGLLTVKNILYIVSFLLLFVITWYISVYVTIKKLEPLTDIRAFIIIKYLAVLSSLISWLLVGRKIRFGQTIPRILNWLLLGPFNSIKIKKLNLGQHKALWIGMVLIVFLILFPPWIAYRYASGDQGLGDSEFVGFHFVLSTKYDVLYDAPYIIAEIDHKIQLIMIVSVLVCSFSSIFFLAKKPVKAER
jgi:hypothetical protein